MKNYLAYEQCRKDNFVLIGIACHVKEYRFCWLLNNQLGIDLLRIKDMEVATGRKKNMENSFPVFYYEDINKQEQYFLIGNHGAAGEFLEKQPQADYILLICDMNQYGNVKSLVEKIKQIGQVLTAFNIIPNDISGIEFVLSDLELLLMEHQQNINTTKVQ